MGGEISSLQEELTDDVRLRRRVFSLCLLLLNEVQTLSYVSYNFRIHRLEPSQDTHGPEREFSLKQSSFHLFFFLSLSK